MIFMSCLLACCTKVSSPEKSWTAQDQKAMTSAYKHCENEGKCLVTFKKVEESIYTAICGRENR